MSPAPTPFDAALRLLPGPVTVIGARCGDQLGGLTAAWVTRVSIDPPLLIAAIGHQRHTFELLADAAGFTVSVLHADQVEVGRLFGLNSRREIDKWAETPHDLLGDGLPVVRGCSAHYLCRIAGRFTTGDHDCLVGHIEMAAVDRGGPALPMRGADYTPRPVDD